MDYQGIKRGSPLSVLAVASDLAAHPTPTPIRQPERSLEDVLDGMWGRIDQIPHTDINNRRAGKPAQASTRQQHVSVKPPFKEWNKKHRAKSK